MQLFPNVYEISSEFGGRWLKQYLLRGQDKVLLLDTGVITTPETVIFPYLEKLGLSPRNITMAIALHVDGDHHGGLPAVKNASAGTLLGCGRADVALIEDPDVCYAKRMNFLAEKHGLGFGREVMVYSPEGRKIDAPFSGGETIRLSPDWEIEVWHVPGHSEGHLAIYDRKNRAAFTSDAVQSNGYPTVNGGVAFGPTYYEVNAYLNTVHLLESKPIDHMFGGHWPGMHGDSVRKFLASTRAFVERTDELLTAYLRDHRRGATLKQIILDLSPKLGPWPQDMALILQFAMYGHLARMEQGGKIRRSTTIPVTYAVA